MADLPPLALAVLRLSCPASHREELAGDLAELRARRLERGSRMAAGARLALDLVAVAAHGYRLRSARWRSGLRLIALL